MADPKPVIVFFGDLMIHLDEDQTQALLLRGQILKCQDTRIEHYHLLRTAGDRSVRGSAIDLRPAQPVGENEMVAEMIARCTKGTDQ